MIYGTAAGRITKDAELRFVGDGTPVLGFTVASDVGYGDKKHAVFVNCSMWGKRGEAVEAYVKKGTPVTVVGELDLREWESNGKSGTSLDMRVQELVLQGSKRDSDNNQSSQGGFRKSDVADHATPTDNDFDDDIPF
jgi:single-strand DNA-binding protein